MSHDPERLAAAYLDGMPVRERRRYEDHLLECDPCWREVSLGRAGRELAESIADPAPAGIRELIRAAVTAAAAERESPAGAPHRRRLTLAGAALSIVLAVFAGVGAWRPWRHPGPAAPVVATSPSTLTVAVASYRDDRLPGTVIPAQQAPDLSTLGLRLVSAAAGTIDGIEVTMFAYRAESGTRLDLYRSALPIPETDEAQHLGGTERAWGTNVNGITVICGGDTHTALVISTDAVLVRQAADLLSIA